MNSVMYFAAAAFFILTIIQHSQVEGMVRVDEEVGALKKAQDICKTKSGVSDEVYRAAMDKNIMDFTDRKLQCYGACIMETMQMMDEKNNIDVSSIIELLGEENKGAHSAHLITCQNEVDDPEKCKKASLFYECMKEKTGPSFYFV